MAKMAILVDGGFYRARARQIFNFAKRTPVENAEILDRYCQRHAQASETEGRELYRVFYYDCPPIAAVVTNPITKERIDLSKSSTFSMLSNFMSIIASKNKVAIRRGKLNSKVAKYSLKPKAQDDILTGKRTVADLTATDVKLDIGQKGVDMRLGLDLVEISLKRLVDQIVLISGDSDFIPAIKMARREGVNVILDTMDNHIPDDLIEHVDETRSFVKDSDFIGSLPEIIPA